jgi:hypothetical protein
MQMRGAAYLLHPNFTSPTGLQCVHERVYCITHACNPPAATARDVLTDSCCERDSLTRPGCNVSHHLFACLSRFCLLPPSKGGCGCVAACVCLSGLLSLSRRRGPALLDSHGGVSWETAPPDLSAASSTQSRCSSAPASDQRDLLCPYCHSPYITALAPEICVLALPFLASFICCIASTVIADLLCCPRSPHLQPAFCLPTQL